MRILLIDTCAEVGTIALADSEQIVGFMELPARSASAALLFSIQSLLHAVSWSIQDMEGICVVSGPGSFTGVRVGMACAKGLCEALGISLAAVSRLRVLAAAAGMKDGLAVLSAGRGQAYVLDVAEGSERMMSAERIAEARSSSRILVAEEQLHLLLGKNRVRMRRIDARSALPLALERFRHGADDLETVDANYVRGEQQIYGKQRLAQGAIG